MSLAIFRQRLHEAAYGENDKKWFPKWLARYADGKTLNDGLLPVTEVLVVAFSKSLLNSGTPATISKLFTTRYVFGTILANSLAK